MDKLFAQRAGCSGDKNLSVVYQHCFVADDKYGLPLDDFFIDSYVDTVIRNNAVLINGFLSG